MTTIPVPAYLLDTDHLEDIREQAISAMDTVGECEHTLACIAATNRELRERRRPPPRAGWPVKLRLVT